MNNPTIGSIVQHHYDVTLVILSFLIAVLGSYVALSLTTAKGNTRDKVIAPAVALGGCAIWSMHFIGMAAYQTPLYVSYDIWPTLASLVIAIVITAWGFWLAARDPRRAINLLLGGTVIGAGVVAMHYLGMFEMDVRAAFDWNASLIVASALIAVVAATVALWLAFHVRSVVQRIGAAVVMGLAVCTMHYTGMAAATLICIASAPAESFSFGGAYVPYLMFVVALTTLLWSAFFSQLVSIGKPASAA